LDGNFTAISSVYFISSQFLIASYEALSWKSQFGHKTGAHFDQQLWQYKIPTATVSTVQYKILCVQLGCKQQCTDRQVLHEVTQDGLNWL